MKEAMAMVMQFISVYSLLAVVCITTPELPAGETVGQWAWFGKTVLFSFGCIVAAFLLQVLGKASWKEALYFRYFSVYVSLSLVLLGAIEAIWGLCQLYGFTVSGHSRYALTGSFFNPGPYAGYLAMVLPLCLHHYVRVLDEWKWISFSLKIEKTVAAVAGILILCVLPATMSRSAWVATAIGCAWVACMHRDRRKWKLLWCRYKKWYISYGVGILFILMLGSVGIFLLKPDSAMGRLFMWKITCQAITNHPWGCHSDFSLAYGEAQAGYFARGDYAGWEERVAGSPEYAFNEYLELALVAGIDISVILLLFVLGCLWLGVWLRRYGICGAVISLLIFSFFSYPMHLPGFIIAGMCLLLACGIRDIIGKPLVLGICLTIWIGGYRADWMQEKDACRNWMNARTLYRSGAYVLANKSYKELYPLLKERGAFLFEYGHSLHKARLYGESNKYLDQAAQYNNDPMILNIMGKNYQELNYYETAERYYRYAIHLLPGRIYPYYLLAKLYAEPKYRDKEKFEEMKRIVLTKEPKVHSTAIEEMRRDVKEIVLVHLH